MPDGDRQRVVEAIPRYGESGIEAARKFVLRAAGTDAAAAFALIARLHQDSPQQTGLDLTAFDACGWPYGVTRKQLRQATDAFSRVFSIPLVIGLDEDSRGNHGRQCNGIRLAPDLLTLFGQDPAGPFELTAILDADAKGWAEIVVAAARSQSGHHLALRCADSYRRSAADFAAHVAAAGIQVNLLRGNEPLGAAVLSAELFSGDSTVVVADGSYLVSEISETVEFEPDMPVADAGVLKASRVATVVLPWLADSRTTYVWRIPDAGPLPPELRHLVATSFGPLGQDPAWRAAHVKGLVPGIDAQSARSLLAKVDDARDADAMAQLAMAVVSDGGPGAMTLQKACALIADPRGGRWLPVVETDSGFDELLLACDPEGLELLGRGHALAKGGRVLAYGPPGGGKSTFAKVLAARIGEASGGAAPVVVEPASILAKGWGATERLLAALWLRAHRSGAVIIADEFDSLAGVREADAPASGNALLIRTLTNEWLRQIDAYPGVPLIVTVNDVDALDPAVRRRFPIAIEVRDELSAEQEYRAWDMIIRMMAPAEWSPTGACVADYVSARDQCRLLGRDDAQSHVAALAKARALRLGQQPQVGRPKRKKGGLH